MTNIKSIISIALLFSVHTTIFASNDSNQSNTTEAEASYDGVLVRANEFMKKAQEHLKNYYANSEMYKTCAAGERALETIYNAPDSTNKQKEEIKKIQKNLPGLCKEIFASFAEQTFRDRDISVDVTSHKDTLKISSPLMSKQMVYKFRNQADIDNTAKKAGFKKILFTDGNNKTWTIDVK